MKSFLYAGVAVLALTAAASAADLTYEPAPAPVVIAPAFNWTGFYVGVHGGGAWGDYSSGILGVPFDLLGSSSGALGGAQIGYNYQINQFVLGVQTDLAYTGISSTTTITPGVDVSAETNWLGSTTLRAGYAWDTWLFYAKGGLAYGQTDFNVSGVFYSDSHWNTGWTAGAGVEKAFTQNITGFLEYDYFDLGNVDNVTPLGLATVDFTANVVKAGINYKF